MPGGVAALLIGGLSLGALSGCAGLDYVLSLAAAQARILAGSVPIEEVLASGRLAPEQADKLRWILDVRRFAVEQMGLRGDGSYTTFYDTGGRPLLYNVTASRKDRLEPKTWTFPFVGTVPYLGFFDAERARAMFDRLAGEGLDVVMYEVDAFSTLGAFPDPVRSPMLERDRISLAETVIHELLHNTIWRPDDVPFNESLATFVGRRGTLDYLDWRAEGGEDLMDPARRYFADLDVYAEFINELYETLRLYYATDMPAEQKIAGREAVFQQMRDVFVSEYLPRFSDPDRWAGLADLPTNNAWVLAVYRYNVGLDLYEGVYTAMGRRWRAALEVFREASRAPSPEEFLRQWLESHRPRR